MFILKLLQQIHLFLFIATRFPHFLLPLVIHHLFNHGSRGAVQVAERRVFGRDLGDVDLGRGGDNVWPPLHAVYFVEMDCHFFARWRRLERPCGIVGVDRVWEISLVLYISIRQNKEREKKRV